MEELRLERIVASASGCSRRDAKQLIKSGRVSVDGKTAAQPDMKVDAAASEIVVDGERVEFKKYYYLMMNKPAGYLSATEDASKKTVLDLLPEKFSRLGLFPAGRLDRDSEGLLLLTNDGDFCHNVISPNKNVKKKYYIETDLPMTESDAEVFKNGAPMGGGETARPAELIITGGCSAYVIISEGKFHQVKRMVAGTGKTVTYLKRVSTGALSLDEKLAPGEYRELTEEERAAVFEKIQ